MPTDNAFIESFNGKFRAEYLNAHWFMSLNGTREKMEAWRKDYNEVRPYSAIGNKPRYHSFPAQRRPPHPEPAPEILVSGGEETGTSQPTARTNFKLD
jgi:transposase InsO family protein